MYQALIWGAPVVQMTKPWPAATAPSAPRATTAWVSPMTFKPSLFAHALDCLFYCIVALFSWLPASCFSAMALAVTGRRALLIWRGTSLLQQLSRQSQPGQSVDRSPAGMLLCMRGARVVPASVLAHSCMAKYRWPLFISKLLIKPVQCADSSC